MKGSSILGCSNSLEIDMELTHDGLFAAAATLTASELKATGSADFSHGNLMKLLAKNVEIVEAVGVAYMKRTGPNGASAWQRVKG